VETAIWIALISALGVTLSAFIQWRSNKATLEAAATPVSSDEMKRADSLIEKLDVTVARIGKPRKPTLEQKDKRCRPRRIR
jgi:hypothetical protein